MNKERDLLQKIVDKQKTLKNPNTNQTTQRPKEEEPKFVYTPPPKEKK